MGVRAMSEARGKGGRSGVERAAILLLTLGEDEAAEILKHMGAKDVQRLGRTMSELSNVSRDEVRDVLGEFTVDGRKSDLARRRQRRIHPQGAGQLRSAKKRPRASWIASASASQRKGLDALKWMDARRVADLVRNEHPQIIAIVLSYLEADQAAEVLESLPDGHALRSGDARRDAGWRAATALAELDDMMEKQFAAARLRPRARRWAGSRRPPKWSTCSIRRSARTS